MAIGYYMLTSLQNFDPIVFLSIDATTLSDEEIDKAREQLNSKIGEYLLLKLSDNLTQQQLSQVTQAKDGTAMMSLLNNLIPSLQNRILSEVENFKKEYLEVLKQGN